MQGKPVEQSVQAFGLELQIESWAKTSGAAQLLERPEAGPSKLLVDLLVASAQLRIDQRPTGEGQPDLILRTPLLVEREQFVEPLLDRFSRVGRGARAPTRASIRSTTIWIAKLSSSVWVEK